MWSVKADYDKIRVAIAYAGGRETQWFSMGPTGDHPLAGDAYTKKDMKGLAADMKEFQQKVEENTSAKLLDIKELLQETLDAARGDKKKLKKVISTCFHENDWPRVQKLLGDVWWDVTAGDIFGEKAPISWDGDWKVGIRPVKHIMCTNDLGHMTVKGFIPSHRSSWIRSREDKIVKAIVQNHPDFVEKVKVLLNLKPPAYMEGGDITAPSEDTLAIGIRYRSNREAAIEISKALPKKTVYAVLKYPEEVGSMWMLQYGEQLNYMFNMVDEGKALVAPYVFDYPKGSRKTFINILKTLSDDAYKHEPMREETDLKTPYSCSAPHKYTWDTVPEKLKPRIKSRIFGGLLKERVEVFKDVGSTEIYKGGKLKGKKDSFVQALIDDEVLDPDGIIFVGGDPDDIDYQNEYEYFVTSMREGWFACNVATLKPGVVMAYHHLLKTNEWLEYNGVNVIKMDGRYVQLVTETGLGSLILPLWRE